MRKRVRWNRSWGNCLGIMIEKELGCPILAALFRYRLVIKFIMEGRIEISYLSLCASPLTIAFTF